MEGNSLHQDLKDILVKYVLICMPNSGCVGMQSMMNRYRSSFAEEERGNLVEHTRSAKERTILNTSFLSHHTNTDSRDGHPTDGLHRNPIH